MPEVLETNYQSMLDVEQGRPRVSWKRFSVRVSGKTNGAHLPWVSKLKYAGQIEVNPSVQSDYTLLFCPIASRVGTDIGEALENIPDNKPIILVVMHHTFNKDHVVAESRRQVNDQRVHLVVDTLFFEGHPLPSNRNDIAQDEIKKFLGVRGHAEVPSRGNTDCCMAVVQLVWAVILSVISYICGLCERCFG